MRNVVVLRDRQFLEGFPKKDGDHWIIMYYSPTCPICKAMVPLMIELSESDALKDERDPSRALRVGVIDCNKAKYACGRAKVKAYPHIQHTVSGGKAWAEFKGEKSIQALQLTSHRAMNPGRYIQPLHNYKELQDATRFNPTQQQQGQIKVVLHVSDPDGPEIKAFRDLVGLAASFTSCEFFVFVRAKATTKLTMYNDVTSIEWPGPAPMVPTTPKEEEKFRAEYGSVHTEWNAADIHQWLVPNRFLAVERLSRENLHEISHKPNTLTVLAVHDSANTAEGEFLAKGLREVASEGQGRHLQNYTFGVMPGQHWKEWLKEYGIDEADFPILIVANAPWGSLYRNDTVADTVREAAKARWSKKMSSAVSEFLDNIAEGLETETAGIWKTILRWFYQANLGYQILVIIMAFVIIVFSLVGCLSVLDGGDPSPPPRRHVPPKSAKTPAEADVQARLAQVREEVADDRQLQDRVAKMREHVADAKARNQAMASDKKTD